MTRSLAELLKRSLTLPPLPSPPGATIFTNPFAELEEEEKKEQEEAAKKVRHRLYSYVNSSRPAHASAQGLGVASMRACDLEWLLLGSARCRVRGAHPAGFCL